MLLPQDFGIVAMAAPVIALGALLADLGLSQALIQREQINDDQINFLFWINVVLSASIASILALASPLIASFYGEPRVAVVIAVLALIMFAGSLSAQHSALLNRRLAFGTLAAIDLSTFLAASLSALAAAYLGLGLWSILVFQACNTALTGVLLWLSSGWLPGRPQLRGVGGRGLLRFGSDIALFNLANFFARNSDNVLIGRFWGEAQLGLYDRAYRLLLLPLGQVMGPIGKVALPLLSRSRPHPSLYRAAFFQMVDLVLLLTFPGAIWAMVTHDQFIAVMLGPKWADTAPIFAVLAIGIFFAPLSACVNWLLITQDRTSEMRNYGLLGSIGFTIAIILGLPGGPLSVAIAYIGFGVVQGPLLWWAVTRRGDIDGRAFIRCLVPHILASAPTFVALLWLQALLPQGFTALMLLLGTAYLLFGGGFVAHPFGRRRLLALLNHLRAMIRPTLRSVDG